MSLTPWFRSPFTDFSGTMVSHQWYGRCAKREMDMIDCFEAYGLDRASQKCEALIEDFKECTNRQKQIQRSVAMRYERNRQYHAGERTKENHYAESPKIDSL